MPSILTRDRFFYDRIFSHTFLTTYFFFLDKHWVPRADREFSERPGEGRVVANNFVWADIDTFEKREEKLDGVIQIL